MTDEFPLLMQPPEHDEMIMGSLRAHPSLERSQLSEYLKQLPSTVRFVNMSPTHVSKTARFATGMIEALGPSHFICNADYTHLTFLHFYQQLMHVIKLSPKTVLVIGPGDHLVSDFLKRKGLTVKTLDNDHNLYPDYLRDIRQDLGIKERFDVVLASEVFEHFDFSMFESSIKNIIPVIGRYLVVSAPYSTIRLFPHRSKYGRVISCEGRLHTYVPWQIYQDMVSLRRFLRFLIRDRFNLGSSWRAAFMKQEYPGDGLNVHHWDLGLRGTDRKTVRRLLSKYFRIVEEKRYVNTNCVFFTLEEASNPVWDSA